MDQQKKRILSIIAFIAIIAVFSFSWLIMNEGDEKKPALANEQPKEETTTPTTDETNNSLEVTEEPTSESITLEGAEQEKTTESAPKQVVTTIGLGSNKELNGQGYIKNNGYLEQANITYNGWSESTTFSVNGKTYREGVGFNIHYGSWQNQDIPVARYLLENQFTKLTGSVGVDDEMADSQGQYRIDFYAQNLDNTITFLSSVENIQANNFAAPFEVDVTGAEMLLIELIKLDTEDKKIKVALVDTKFE